MRTTGKKGLDELLVNCTQLAVDDYKNYIRNYQMLNDSAKVAVYQLQKTFKGKMTVIEGFFEKGMFCAFENDGKKAMEAIKEQMKFNDQDLVSEAEYLQAKKNLQKVGEIRPLFLPIEKVDHLVNNARTNARITTREKIVEKLKKVLDRGHTLKYAVKVLENEEKKGARRIRK